MSLWGGVAVELWVRDWRWSDFLGHFFLWRRFFFFWKHHRTPHQVEFLDDVDQGENHYTGVNFDAECVAHIGFARGRLCDELRTLEKSDFRVFTRLFSVHNGLSRVNGWTTRRSKFVDVDIRVENRMELRWASDVASRPSYGSVTEGGQDFSSYFKWKKKLHTWHAPFFAFFPGKN